MAEGSVPDKAEVLQEAHKKLSQWLKDHQYSTSYSHVLNARNHLGSALIYLQVENADLAEGD